MSRANFARGFFLAHGVAAVFDHDDFLVVALHMRQRFGENPGLVVRAVIEFGCKLRVCRTWTMRKG